MENITITGNIGSVTTTEVKGKTITKFGVAVRYSYKDTDSKWANGTFWYNCVLWREHKGIVKGAYITVSGDMKRREYDDKVFADLNVNSLDFPPMKQDKREMSQDDVPF